MAPCRRCRPALAGPWAGGQSGPIRWEEATVRVRDVMSSPVVTVPPDMRLKEIADLLVRDGISAVPVVCPGSVEVRFLEE
jgi:CBS domain-containing protein